MFALGGKALCEAQTVSVQTYLPFRVTTARPDTLPQDEDITFRFKPIELSRMMESHEIKLGQSQPEIIVRGNACGDATGHHVRKSLDHLMDHLTGFPKPGPHGQPLQPAPISVLQIAQPEESEGGN
jgi:hypothetical protein